MFQYINNKYAFIAFSLVVTLFFILFLLLRKRKLRIKYGNSELELGDVKKTKSYNEDFHPCYSKMILYRDNDLPLSFDLNKWNQFLGYHVCRFTSLCFRR
jgi:hypothetical protein